MVHFYILLRASRRAKKFYWGTNFLKEWPVTLFQFKLLFSVTRPTIALYLLCLTADDQLARRGGLLTDS
jgi:hypothetical protein